MAVVLMLNALLTACSIASVAADCGGCDLSGNWHFFGGKGEEIYSLTESGGKSLKVERTSKAGSWKTASGSVSNCEVDVQFYNSDNTETGTIASDCATVTWKDSSHWDRIAPPAPDLCDKVKGPDASVVVSQDAVALGNGYTCVMVDLKNPSISSLRGDFAGHGAYGANALTAAGVALEREDSDGTIHSSSTAGPAEVKVQTKTAALVKIIVSGIRDSPDAVVTDTWTLSLEAGARSVAFSTSGSLGQNVVAKAVRYNFAFLPTSIYALFDRGVVQMLAATDSKSHYASGDGLGRLYALGGPGGEGHTAGNVSVAMRRVVKGSAGVVVLDSRSGGARGYSGFQEVLAGNLPEKDEWSAGWGSVKASQMAAGVTWTASYDLGPNNFDFPVQGPFGDLTTASNIADEQLQAMLTGIYGSPVGQLCTHDNGVVKGQRVGQMATTIARPGYGYGGNYNFFDPDNYISTSALLFSGDPYLQDQVRMVLERNGDFVNDKGQLPHHFKDVTPTYQALSGETQTGPNVFWVLSCLNYVKTTGNLQWLNGYMPKLRKASAFLFDMITPGFNLLNAPGSLMIDVFIRNHFTTDTNAMAVGFLRDFADAEEATGNTTGAAKLRNIAADVAKSADAMLFDNKTGDHYVTQLNPDGSTRDFVDYDANLIALAHGISSPDRAKKVFQRLDSGRCIHGRATFVSEKYYGKHDTTHGNTGDSWCAMGRIGWFDALARKRYGDQKTFDSLLMDPLVGDVNRWTWLHERYHCDGTPETNRTSHYFEYPSVTAMMLHFVRYGIQLGFKSITVTPFGPAAFHYHVGTVHVEYDSKAGSVALSMPGTGKRSVTIEHLKPGQPFTYNVGPGSSATPWPSKTCQVTASGKATSNSDGTLTFDAIVGDDAGPCIITAKAEPADLFV